MLSHFSLPFDESGFQENNGLVQTTTALIMAGFAKKKKHWKFSQMYFLHANCFISRVQ